MLAFSMMADFIHMGQGVGHKYRFGRRWLMRLAWPPCGASGLVAHRLVTLRECFLVNARDFARDREAHHFNKVSETLDMSRVQLTAYLDATEAALRQAMGFPRVN